MRLLRVLLAGWLVCHTFALTAQSVNNAASQPQATVQADQPIEYKLGQGITPPKLIHSVDPSFTKEARKKKVQGLSVLNVVVGTDGKPSSIMVVRSLAEGVPPKKRDAAESLDREAVKAVEQYRFEPFMRDGKPIPVSLHVEVRFSRW